MQKRAVRLSLLALLLVTGFGAAYVTWDISTRVWRGLAIDRDVDARLDRMSAAAASLGAAQQAYVAPGQQRGEALTRASVLVQQLYDDIAALRSSARSSGAAPALLAFGEVVDGLVNVDDRVREHLRDGEELIAADLVYTEARQTIEGMGERLRELRLAETASGEAERRALLEREAMVIGGTAALWLVGVLLLARAPRAAAVVAAPAAEIPAVEHADPSSSVDLQAAARVCTELARLSSGSGLAPVMARAARVLDASGLIVWLGAGEELFPATAHGYGPRTLARFGPVPRSGDNATATAWRTATMSTVPGTPETNGAIVAPLFGPNGCFGVLSAEVRSGRERDDATRAVTAMLAAQLSAVVAPWPAPSFAETTETNRQDATAASA